MKILAKGLIGLFIIFAPFTVSLKNRSNHGAADGAEFVKGFAGLEFKHLTAGAKGWCSTQSNPCGMGGASCCESEMRIYCGMYSTCPMSGDSPIIIF